jgi:hypothetical protein
MMRKTLAILWIAMLPGQAHAVSEAVTPWLLFSMGARASGMGGAHVTEASGADGVYWNPANLGFYLPASSITGMHFAPVPDLTDDVYFEYASYADYVEGWGGWGANIMFLSYGKSEATDETGIRLREFSSWEMGFGGGYGTKLSDRWSGGVGAKVIMSYLSPRIGELEEGQGITWAVDFGVHGRQLLRGLSGERFFARGLRIGAAVLNLGPALKFIDNGAPNPLPLNFRLGIGFDPYMDETHRFTLAADVNKVLVRQTGDGLNYDVDPGYKALFTAWGDEPFRDEVKDAIYNFGLEYGFANFIFLRTGWVHDVTGDITDYTFGIGVTYEGLRFDYGSYPQATGLANVNRFSITYDF